jgi:RNA polymerase sigma factor (TIGR02999 family)
MRGERADQTLQATALVHEAYIRLVDQTLPKQWDGRWHFFAAAAEAMRRILVDNARRRGRIKRGGDRARTDWESVQLVVQDPPHDLIALDEALELLAEEHPEKAQLVKLRYFAGLSMDDAAAAIGVSPTTADRYWAFARAWLYRQMK